MASGEKAVGLRVSSRYNQCNMKYWTKRKTMQCSTSILNLGGDGSFRTYRNGDAGKR